MVGEAGANHLFLSLINARFFMEMVSSLFWDAIFEGFFKFLIMHLEITTK